MSDLVQWGSILAVTSMRAGMITKLNKASISGVKYSVRKV